MRYTGYIKIILHIKFKIWSIFIITEVIFDVIWLHQILLMQTCYSKVVYINKILFIKLIYKLQRSNFINIISTYLIQYRLSVCNINI